MLRDSDSAKSLLVNLVKSFVDKGLLNDASMGDLIMTQFSSLLENPDFISALHSFWEDDDHLDDFYFGFCGMSEEYKDLWNVVWKILTLSHGNALVSRCL